MEDEPLQPAVEESPTESSAQQQPGPQVTEEGPAEPPLKVSEGHFSEDGRRMETKVLSEDPKDWPEP